MRVITFSEYGPPHVLQINTVTKPVPKDNEVRVQIRATTVSSGDGYSRRGNPFSVRFVTGLIKPKVILGSEFAGIVDSVGKNVTRFKKGDAVFGSTGMKMGTNAEYICIAKTGTVVQKPANMTFAEAATIPFGATTALAFLRDKGKIQAGQKVLIYGASGSVGTAAVQLARQFGAQVTGVCSTRNVAFVKSLGAEHVIDYMQEDAAHHHETYDLIFDAIGKYPFSQTQHLLNPNGTYLSVALSLSLLGQMVWSSIRGGKKVLVGIVNGTTEDLIYLKQLVEAGKLKSAIDSSHPFDQIVEAHRIVDTGHKRGNVVVTLE
ncbi:MAG: NAD(P)-dependent alcohol dehydrogenase [Chloroflexota bacterium]